MTTDMQEVAFEHLDLRRTSRGSTRETPGRLVSKLTNDISFVQQAALAALNTAVRDMLSVVALAISMFYLDWVMSLIVLCVYPHRGAPHCGDQPAPAPRRQAARRTSSAT